MLTPLYNQRFPAFEGCFPMQSLLETFHDSALDLMACGAAVEPWLGQFALFLQSRLPGSTVGISVLDRPGRTFRHSTFPALPRAFSERLENNIIVTDRGTCGLAILSGRPIDVPDVTADARFAPQWTALLQQYGLTSILSTPALDVESTPQGCIAVLHAVATPLDADQHALIQAAATLCAKVCRYSRTRESHQLLIGELEHRMRNIFAVIGGVADVTLKSNPEPKGFREAFGKRLVMMHRAHAIAMSADEMDLGTLLHEVLGPYAGHFDIQCQGPAVQLVPEAASALALVINELATNAAKYGALSVPGGVLQVQWSVAPEDGRAEPVFGMAWMESNGPCVAPPARKGYGTAMINGSLRNAFEGAAVLAYEPAGFRCEIRAPFTERLGKRASL
ncbi:HWE histidine kinase domain-containing protein [Pseudomonas syringae]